MKTLNNLKLVLLTAVFLMMAGYAYSYPPDNAAVLYYKAASSYQPQEQMQNMLINLIGGKIEPNETIREFVKTNHLVIDMLIDASQVKNCDWGLDFSQGLEMEMPQMASMRKLSYLVLADAKILAKDGNYDAAIGRCTSIYKMARHVNDRVLISYLVAVSINSQTNECLTQIMSDMPLNVESLNNLKRQLTEIDSIPFSVKPAILAERECMLTNMTAEQLPKIVNLCEEVDKSIKEKILSLDEAALNRNRAYFENYYAGVIAAFDMLYLKGDTALKNLNEKLQGDIKYNNPDAILTGVLGPALNKIYSITTRFKTHNNAIRTAVEVYIIKAKTGKLPDVLPDGLPGDLFSDKPFAYEKTAEGFVLRCQGKDLSKNEIYEYKFKVKK